MTTLEINGGVIAEPGTRVTEEELDGTTSHGELCYDDILDEWYVRWDDGGETVVLNQYQLVKE